MADEDDDSQKTEEPTRRKLEQTRQKGQVPLSREVNNWLMLFAATALVGIMSPYVLSELSDVLRRFIAEAHNIPSVPGGLGLILGQTVFDVFKVLALPFLVLIIVAAAGPLLQVGLLFAPESILPKFSKISPIKGFSRIFSMRSIMEFIKGIFKIGIIGVVGYFILSPYFGQVEHLIDVPIEMLLFELKDLFIKLMSGVLVVFFVIAGIDLIYQRQDHHKKMMMTRQEVKDEFKQSEGDPHVKAKLRGLRQERARARMMQAVPEADVVITNPTHYAVALKYDQEKMAAPQVVAKGVDQVAQRIRILAQESKVEIVENPPLARTLHAAVEVNEYIPAEHYQAVAQVISYVFRKRGKI